MEPLLSSADLAQLLNVSLETVRFWRKQGRGPRAVKVGRTVRYQRCDVDLWLVQNTEPASAGQVA